MWLNSTLVFLRDFGGWGFRSGATGYSGEGGGRGDIFLRGMFPGNWRVWAKPRTDPSVDKRSRERRRTWLASTRRRVFSLAVRFEIRFRRKSPSGHRSRVARALASQRLSARSARDSSGSFFLIGKWERP